MKTVRHTSGFSLIELMVALVVGLFIVGGLATVMMSSRINYETQDQSSRTQESARFAMEFLTYDLRHATYAGCADLGTQLLDGAATTTYGDQLSFGYSDPNTSTKLTTAGFPGATTIQVSSVEGLTAGDEISLSDCGASFTTTIGAISGNSISLDTPLPRIFEVSLTKIHKFTNHVYDVQINGDGIPGLYRDGVEMVEGIEFIRALYGEDTDGDDTPDIYRPYDEVLNWNAVMGLKLGMLIRSISNYKPDETRQYGIDIDTKSYDILDLNAANSTAVTPPQGVLQVVRQVFTNTIMVRNHI